MKLQGLIALLLNALPAQAQMFTEETATAGVTGVYAGDWQYMVGGGAAAFDCSGDGFADLFIAGGSDTATFYRNTSAHGGALTFALQTSGLEIDAVTGAYPLDIDNDGLTDLAILRVGETVLMRGSGDCRFERANEAWGFAGGNDWGTAFAATWEAGADWPTLVVGTYVDRTQEAFPWGSCTPQQLYRPGAAGFAAPHALKPGHCTLSMLFTDWNRSGTPSLRVSNDREYYKGGTEQMWQMPPGAEPVLYTEAEGWKPLKIWGMGIASYDVTLDGYPEYFLTSMADNKLQSLSVAEGEVVPTYGDVAFARGLTAHRPYTGGDLRPSTAWHAQFEDVNNDGLVDLFVAKGNVAEMPDFAANDPNNLLMQGADGTFAEKGDVAGVASMAVSRGAVVEDFNLDGLVDLVVVNRWQSAQVWRNTTPDAGRWVELRLQQDGANRDAIGSWIEVRLGQTVLRREITVGGGHASGQIGWRHFGIGAADRAEVRVIWPDGGTDDWQVLTGNRQFVLHRGKPAEVWTPR